ncbi:hypothetical protein M406DRAFT_350415 [Cryphonectria parasitica EP155]|uniref:Uncharacterized protein n=1 Tax=Cryphonectria parasitica (strain ATCC 38755 / EP155) TaxID=660469 RepID=A0A9P4Y538_CRYP1|nr:uncharacterized protein M406DRAFT_350415 [Cryphonectria parasitica EP155]KAF3767124.1 hypothetical protein M406DRAFT_350415 [Cryphonectria parasitica EP155]
METPRNQAGPRKSGMMERLRRLRSDPKPEIDPTAKPERPVIFTPHRAAECVGEGLDEPRTPKLDDRLGTAVQSGSKDEAGQESTGRQPDDNVEMVVQPPKGGTGSSDYEAFLQKAVEDERQRVESGQTSVPKPKQQPQLNQFYSQGWADASPAAQPKLAEIQESESEPESDDNGDDDVSSRDTGDISPTQQRGLGRQDSSSSSTSSGSHDFADSPDTRPTLTQTWPGADREGRHVSFKEPTRVRNRSDSNPNLYTHTRCSESPQGRRAIARRKSIRRTITDYVRQLT